MPCDKLDQRPRGNVYPIAAFMTQEVFRRRRAASR